MLQILTAKQAKAQFKRRSTANNVQISIPVPEDADTPKFRTNIGSVHYAPETSSIVWKIKQFGGGKEFLMRAELGLPSVRGDDEKGGGMMGGFGGSMGGVGAGGKAKRPIGVKFEIPYFTTSGIQVRYLKIIEPKVSPRDCGLDMDQTNIVLASIPLVALGAIYHAEWRHCCASAGCSIRKQMSPCYFELVTELALLFAKHGDGVWARGRALADGILQGYDDTDSAPDAVLTETRVSLADTNNLHYITSNNSCLFAW